MPLLNAPPSLRRRSVELEEPPEITPNYAPFFSAMLTAPPVLRQPEYQEPPPQFPYRRALERAIEEGPPRTSGWRRAIGTMFDVAFPGAPRPRGVSIGERIAGTAKYYETLPKLAALARMEQESREESRKEALTQKQIKSEEAQTAAAEASRALRERELEEVGKPKPAAPTYPKSLEEDIARIYNDPSLSEEERARRISQRIQTYSQLHPKTPAEPSPTDIVMDTAKSVVAAKRSPALEVSKFESWSPEDKKEVIAEYNRLRSVPPSELDVALKQALLAQRNLAIGSEPDPENVKYWVGQVKKDAANWNMVQRDQRLARAVREGLAAEGVDLAKMDAQTRDAARFAATALKHFPEVYQTIDELEKAGQLGPLLSRWNDFLTGKVGTGAEFAKLRNNIGLIDTAMGRVHGGARGGGSQVMLEHFKSMLNARVMDAATLRSSLKVFENWLKGYAEMGGRGGPEELGRMADQLKTSGKIPAGARVRRNRTTGEVQYSTDGKTWIPVTGGR